MIKRRSFIQTAGMSAVALTLPVVSAVAQEKSNITIGTQGASKYPRLCFSV